MDATKYNQILNYIRSNLYPDDFSKIMKHGLRRLSQKITIDGEKLFFVGKGKKAQVIVGEELAKHIFNKLHSSLIGGHSGTNKTKKSIGSCFYWPNMPDIEQWNHKIQFARKVHLQGVTAPNRNEHEGTDRFYLTKKEGS